MKSKLLGVAHTYCLCPRLLQAPCSPAPRSPEGLYPHHPAQHFCAFVKVVVAPLPSPPTGVQLIQSSCVPVHPKLSQTQPHPQAPLFLWLRFTLLFLSHSTYFGTYNSVHILSVIFKNAFFPTAEFYVACSSLHSTLSDIISFDPHTHVLSSRSREGSCGSERWNYFPRVTQLASSRAGFWPGG